MMRDETIGAVLVSDRGLVVRTMAEGGDPNQTTVAQACSDDLVTVAPDDPGPRGGSDARACGTPYPGRR
jgi:hypothetical protein